MNIKYRPSNAYVIKSVPYSDDAPFGVQEIEAVVPGAPCMVVFGGELTCNARFANHFIKRMKRMFAENGVTGADIYSVYYDFGSRDANLEREQLFRVAKRRLESAQMYDYALQRHTQHMIETEPTPKYIKQLYNVLLAPILRSSDKNVKNVIANASKIRMFGHSHGAAVIYMLGEYMAQQMKIMGYTANEIRDVQKSVVAIQHGPIVPLEHPRFTTLSFASASDTRMSMHNNVFSDYACYNAENMYPCYFPHLGAHLFAAGQLKEDFVGEHNTPGLLNDEYDLLTPDGRTIFAAERSAITNSVRAAVYGRPTPTVPELVTGPKVDFQYLKHNGECFYKMMLRDIMIQNQQNLGRANQK